jgi:UDP-N-acetylmuramoyl-L-alanyl-D-glutamate--2,6-diaminopimelate ligase
MELEIATVKAILTEHGLLKEIKSTKITSITGISYDSRTVKSGYMFFCKGNFKPEYLSVAKQNGATTYVAEQAYPEGTGMTAIIVTNVTRAMAVLSATYFDFPQNQLFIVGITGTKGKTSSAYFAHAILNQKYPDQVALFSTIDRIIGPKPEHQFKSDLTTPESMDLFHDMRAAVDNGMKYLVMEVSSQAYLRDRVYGLKFDCGIFLNITPDHIGRNEHKDFEDYLHCKLQLMVNSKRCIIDADTDRFDDVLSAAKATTDPDQIYLFSTDQQNQIADYWIQDQVDNLSTNKFAIKANAASKRQLEISGSYDLNVAGDYNQSNATAAIMAAAMAGAQHDDAQIPLALIVIPGRMEHLEIPGHGVVFVDYAHNYASLSALLKFLKHQHQMGKVLVVVGSPGDKGISRRAGFGQALSEEADIAYLTTDDPAFEDPNEIIKAIMENIQPNTVEVRPVLDRYDAIQQAIMASGPDDVVVLAGKGEDPYQKVKGIDTPWPTDMGVAEEIKRGLS